MSKKNNLIHQMTRRIDGRCVMEKPGERNKTSDKAAGKGLDKEKIYSWSTRNSYIKALTGFVKWCVETHSKEIKRIDDCEKYVNEWLQNGIDRGLSPFTLKQYASAAAKLYGCATTDFIKTPPRKRSEITRSRGEAVRDKGFNEIKNKDLVDFCKHTGLRRSEIEKLRGTDLRWINGQAYIHVKGKGGRERDVPILHQNKAVIVRLEKAGEAKVWGKVSSHADIHGYRRDYANTLYRDLERPMGEVPKKERYICKGDLAGRIYDKKAMKVVTEALGHSRLSVIAGNYLEA